MPTSHAHEKMCLFFCEEKVWHFRWKRKGRKQNLNCLFLFKVWMELFIYFETRYGWSWCWEPMPLTFHQPNMSCETWLLTTEKRRSSINKWEKFQCTVCGHMPIWGYLAHLDPLHIRYKCKGTTLRCIRNNSPPSHQNSRKWYISIATKKMYTVFVCKNEL